MVEARIKLVSKRQPVWRVLSAWLGAIWAGFMHKNRRNSTKFVVDLFVVSLIGNELSSILVLLGPKITPLSIFSRPTDAKVHHVSFENGG